MDATLLVPARRSLTTTERNGFWALLGTVGLFAVFYAVGRAERAADPAADRTTRFVYEATETTTRLLAVAHTLVATLFLATSTKIRSARGATTLVGLALLSVALCLGFSALGGREGGVAMGLFAFYFLLHDLRDEAWFYGANGDAPPEEARRAGLRLGGFVLGVLLATLALGVAIGLRRPTRLLGIAGWSDGARIAAAGAVALAALGAAHLCLRSFGGGRVAGAPGEMRRHRPLVVALVGVYAVFFGGIALTGRFYALVAMHVVIWYVFTLRRLGTAPRPAVAPRPFTWRWMRSTVAGFNVLHLGIVGLLAAAGVVWAFAFQNDRALPGFRLLLARDAFPYWTLVHVTLSWMPRR